MTKRFPFLEYVIFLHAVLIFPVRQFYAYTHNAYIPTNCTRIYINITSHPALHILRPKSFHVTLINDKFIIYFECLALRSIRYYNVMMAAIPNHLIIQGSLGVICIFMFVCELTCWVYESFIQ